MLPTAPVEVLELTADKDGRRVVRLLAEPRDGGYVVTCDVGPLGPPDLARRPGPYVLSGREQALSSWTRRRARSGISGAT